MGPEISSKTAVACVAEYTNGGKSRRSKALRRPQDFAFGRSGRRTCQLEALIPVCSRFFERRETGTERKVLNRGMPNSAVHLVISSALNMVTEHLHFQGFESTWRLCMLLHSIESAARDGTSSVTNDCGIFGW